MRCQEAAIPRSHRMVRSVIRHMGSGIRDRIRTMTSDRKPRPRNPGRPDPEMSRWLAPPDGSGHPSGRGGERPVEPGDKPPVVGVRHELVDGRRRFECAEHLLELRAVILAVIILLVEHDLDAREGGVARLGVGGVSVVTVAVEMSLGVEDHGVDGVDREVDVRLGEAIHSKGSNSIKIKGCDDGYGPRSMREYVRSNELVRWRTESLTPEPSRSS